MQVVHLEDGLLLRFLGISGLDSSALACWYTNHRLPAAIRVPSRSPLPKPKVSIHFEFTPSVLIAAQQISATSFPPCEGFDQFIDSSERKQCTSYGNFAAVLAGCASFRSTGHSAWMGT